MPAFLRLQAIFNPGHLRLIPLYQARPDGGNETAGGLCKQ